jgi:hypothetical protein
MGGAEPDGGFLSVNGSTSRPVVPLHLSLDWEFERPMPLVSLLGRA